MSDKVIAKKDAFTSFCTFFDMVLQWVGITLMIVMTVAVGIQVFFRYVLNDPTAWSEQLSQYSFLWMTLFGGALAVREGTSLDITFIINRAKGWPKKVLQIAIQALIMYVSFYWCYSGVLQVRNTWKMIEAGINIKLGIFYLVVPIAFGFMILFALENIVNVIRGVARREGDAE